MLNNWGISQEEVAAARVHSSRATRDNRICACGHPARAHTSESDSSYHEILKAAGRHECRPTRIQCPCAVFTPVIESTDVRKFSFKTDGTGAGHALAKGIAAAIDSQVDLKWVPGTGCAKCKREGIMLYPVSVGSDGIESNKPERRNAVLCGDCRSSISGVRTGEEV